MTKGNHDSLHLYTFDQLSCLAIATECKRAFSAAKKTLDWRGMPSDLRSLKPVNVYGSGEGMRCSRGYRLSHLDLLGPRSKLGQWACWGYRNRRRWPQRPRIDRILLPESLYGTSPRFSRLDNPLPITIGTTSRKWPISLIPLVVARTGHKYQERLADVALKGGNASTSFGGSQDSGRRLWLW